MRMVELEGKSKVKAQMRRGNVPLGSRKRTPLLGLVVLELESSNPKRVLQLRGWQWNQFVLEREVLLEKCQRGGRRRYL